MLPRPRPPSRRSRPAAARSHARRPTPGGGGDGMATLTTDIRRVQANGIDFAYLEAGPQDGPLALCLHGFPAHAKTWRHLLPALGDAGWHAVAPWMRGYHPTGLAPDGRYQSAVLSQDAVALVEALGDRRAVIIGHDWGAIAASGAAILAPESMSRLVCMTIPHLGVCF